MAASKWGYCVPMGREHQLSDFHSRPVVMHPLSKRVEGERQMHTEMCRHCGKRPSDD